MTASAARSPSVLGREGSSDDIPTTGQDATDEGLQRVLLGTQCMTVYKAIKKEADAAANARDRARQGRQGRRPTRQATGEVKDTETNKAVKSVLLEPQAIFPENVKDVIADGFTTAEKVCSSAELQKACEENGVSG